MLLQLRNPHAGEFYRARVSIPQAVGVVATPDGTYTIVKELSEVSIPRAVGVVATPGVVKLDFSHLREFQYRER